MTTSVGLHEAKTQFSKLLRRVAAGEEITITSRGHDVARLVPPARPARRELGFDRGRFVVPDTFEAPLPDDLLDTFER